MEEKEIEKAKLHTSKEWTQKKFGENLFTLMRAKGIGKGCWCNCRYAILV